MGQNSLTSLLSGRIEAVRTACKSSIEYDSGKVGPGLTDRAFLAQSVLNILDGLIDDQLQDEELQIRGTVR